jgi:hypothetical protein
LLPLFVMFPSTRISILLYGRPAENGGQNIRKLSHFLDERPHLRTHKDEPGAPEADGFAAAGGDVAQHQDLDTGVRQACATWQGNPLRRFHISWMAVPIIKTGDFPG